MEKKETTIDDILEAVTKGFEQVDNRLVAIERRLATVEDRTGSLEDRMRSVEMSVRNLPDHVDETYGKMLNDHEDRIRILEPA